MNYKYKVGDRVRVLDGSGIEDYTGIWDKRMAVCIDKVGTVCATGEILGRAFYSLDGLPEISALRLNISYVFDERGIAAELYDMAGRYLTSYRIHGVLMLTCEDDIRLLALHLQKHLLAWTEQHRYRRHR